MADFSVNDNSDELQSSFTTSCPPPTGENHPNCAQVFSPMISSPNVAAAKVFAISELLEMILLSASDGTVMSKSHSSEDEYHLPNKQLFQLQRVNYLFKATIARNKLLQERMFLRSSSTGSLAWSPIASLVHSLRNHLGEHLFTISKSGSRIEIRVSCQVNFKDKSHQQLPAFLSPEASWRKMAIYSSDGCGRRVAVSNNDGRYGKVELLFSKSANLGKLADVLQQRADYGASRDTSEKSVIEGIGALSVEESDDEREVDSEAEWDKFWGVGENEEVESDGDEYGDGCW